jgi:F-type H+-transporting ATPase subunit delta
LARAVFGQAVSAETLALVERVVTHPRGRGIRYSLKFVGDLVAFMRNRLVAIVTAARPLASAQASALAKTLASAYGRDIQLNVTVDASLVGGLRVRVDDDVVDGSLLTRFAEARRDLAA